MQVEGELEDGRPFYFRARHRVMILDISHKPGEIMTEEGFGFEVRGFPDDDHMISSFSNDHLFHLIHFMSDILDGAIEWRDR